MVMVMATHGLSQILDIGELVVLRGISKIGGELGELTGGRRIALRLGGLSRARKVRGDLLGDLLILGGVRLLELLECVQHLSERRKLAAVGLLERRRTDAVQIVPGCCGTVTDALKRSVEKRLDVAVEIVYRRDAHDCLIGIFPAAFQIP